MNIPTVTFKQIYISILLLSIIFVILYYFTITPQITSAAETETTYLDSFDILPSGYTLVPDNFSTLSVSESVIMKETDRPLDSEYCANMCTNNKGLCQGYTFQKLNGYNICNFSNTLVAEKLEEESNIISYSKKNAPIKISDALF